MNVQLSQSRQELLVSTRPTSPQVLAAHPYTSPEAPSLSHLDAVQPGSEHSNLEELRNPVRVGAESRLPTQPFAFA